MLLILEAALKPEYELLQASADEMVIFECEALQRACSPHFRTE